MSAGLGSKEAVASEKDVAEDERRRLSLVSLIGLAAGGVIGAGWLTASSEAYAAAGGNAFLSSLIAGALMLVVAVVMVELGTATRKTGGLVFLPLQSSGPLMAALTAAGVWLFYAVTPASEAVAMVRGSAQFGWGQPMLHYWHSDGSSPRCNTALSPYGFGVAVGCLVLMTTVCLLGPYVFMRINTLLTMWKILVPLLVIAWLQSVPVNYGNRPGSLSSVLGAVTGSGLVYAYLGFQGPLNVAGNIRSRGRLDEAARLRWAVYGTVCGSIALYTVLQYIVSHRHGSADSPCSAFQHGFTTAGGPRVVHDLVQVDALLSPLGAGLVYTYLLTHEVAALSRAHLTHRGLQTSRSATLKLGRRKLPVYWRILLVNLIVGVLVLPIAFAGVTVLSELISVVALVVYAVPGVVLASLQRRHPDLFSPRSRMLYRILAEFGFVVASLILYQTQWNVLFLGMATLITGCGILLGLPLLVRGDPPFLGRLVRRYDAKPYAAQRNQWPESAQSAAVLLGYFTVLTLMNGLSHLISVNSSAWVPETTNIVGSVAAVGAASIAFRWLVRLSCAHMDRHKPLLPRRSSSVSAVPE